MITWNDINSEIFIKRLKSDDENVFADLYSVVIHPLTAFLIKEFEGTEMTSADAEEIADETMIKVSKAVSSFDPQRGGAKLTTWIFEIGRNQVKDFLRSCKSGKAQAISKYLQREKELKNQAERLEINNRYLESICFDSPKKQQIVENQEDILARKAFDALKESDQDIIRMRRVMEYEDIAKVENKSIESIRTQHKRALDRLKQNLNEAQKEED